MSKTQEKEIENEQFLISGDPNSAAPLISNEQHI